MKKTALVLGCNGFIGYNLVERLKSEGYRVFGVDNRLENQAGYTSNCDVFFHDDAGDYVSMRSICQGLCIDECYQLAADMGGAGYIFTGENDFQIMQNSVMINWNVARLTAKGLFKKVFFSSSACVYPMDEDTKANLDTRECAAYPANPDSEYGWEKLFSERMYLALNRKIGKPVVRIARFHNIYGPHGTYKGGKEKAPAAMIRKAIELDNGSQMEVWGDGSQVRTFLYIDDCLDGIRALMEHETFVGPVNIGSEQEITINKLATTACIYAGKMPNIKNVPGPTGVSHRKSNNELAETVLNWSPKIQLSEGMLRTYEWIFSEMNKPENSYTV